MSGKSARWHGAVCGAAATLLLGSFATPAAAGIAIALTDDNRLVQFDTGLPAVIQRNISVNGLDAGENLLGIDFRPARPTELFSLSNLGQVYRLNAATGSATKVGAPLDATTTPLNGLNYGVDFNPTVDRIRVVSDLGENLRLNPNDGTLSATDGSLAYKAGDANEGIPAGVSSAAYTNSAPGPMPATTVLYGIDSEAGTLVTISPPNDGVLNTVGSLNLPTLPLFTGFDIDPEEVAYATTTFEPAGSGFGELQSTFYRVDLATGAATDLGVIGDGSLSITGFAVAGTPAAVPLPPAALAAPIAGLVGWFYARRLRRSQDNV
jgi:hypothetical protein